MIMKKILIILSLGLVIALAVGYYQWNKPKRTAADEKPVASLTADDLFMAYAENETASNAAYLNKVVEVSGTIISTETDPTGATVAYLETSDLLGTVSCTFVPDNTLVITTGEQITVKGICTGMLTDVILTQCVKQ